MTKRALVIVTLIAVGGWIATRTGTDPTSSTHAHQQPTQLHEQPIRTAAPGAADNITTTTPAPTDTAHKSPAIDLGQPPDATNPAETARWWAATYTTYAGAEPPPQLAARLADHSTPELRTALGSASPAASYDPPLTIRGAVARRAPNADPPAVWVSVETSASLVVYAVTLRYEDGCWKVQQANHV